MGVVVEPASRIDLALKMTDSRGWHETRLREELRTLGQDQLLVVNDFIEISRCGDLLKARVRSNLGYVLAVDYVAFCGDARERIIAFALGALAVLAMTVTPTGGAR
jgi:hypothetical protein